MKVVLTIAGSDPSGGAGIQADLKTFEAFGLFGTSAITVLTAQNTTGVRSISELAPAFVKEQLEAIAEDFDIAAVKVGMLYSKAIIETVDAFLETLDVPIVIDPVSISKAGSSLLQDDALEALPKIFRHATVITPNQHEASQLFGYRFGDTKSLEKIIALDIPVLIKNHTLEMPEQTMTSIDQLFFGHQRRLFQTPYLDTNDLHGTGCSYSSAIAANLALGKTLEEALEVSKWYIHNAIKAAPGIGHGPGPINHKAGLLLTDPSFDSHKDTETIVVDSPVLANKKGLLIIAHGSRREASNIEFETMVSQLRERVAGSFAKIEASFLEFATPDIDEAIDTMRQAGITEIRIYPFFLNSGKHVHHDIPEKLEGARVSYPEVSLELLPHFGSSEHILSVITKDLEE